jgi:hypothetical protein
VGEGGATVESTVETIVEDELGPSTLGNEVVGDADPLIIFSFLTSFLSAGFKGNTTDCSDTDGVGIVGGKPPGSGGGFVSGIVKITFWGMVKRWSSVVVVVCLFVLSGGMNLF